MPRKPNPQTNTFCGRTFLGPEHDHAPDHLPDDSPKRHANRKGPDEQRHDSIAARLAPPKRSDTHEWWALPDGTTARHSIAAHKALSKKAGWTFIGPDRHEDKREPDLDVKVEIGDGQTMSKRDDLEFQLAAMTRDANEKPRLTGRRFLVDGEIVHERDGTDAPVAGPHAWRKDES